MAAVCIYAMDSKALAKSRDLLRGRRDLEFKLHDGPPPSHVARPGEGVLAEALSTRYHYKDCITVVVSGRPSLEESDAFKRVGVDAYLTLSAIRRLPDLVTRCKRLRRAIRSGKVTR